MYIRPKIRAQLHQVLAITIFWMGCGAFFALYKCVIYDASLSKFVFSVPYSLSLGEFMVINLLGPAIGGIIGGSIMVFVLNERYRNKSYGHFLLSSIFFFLFFIFVLNTIVSYFFYHKEQIVNSDDSLREAIDLLLLNPYAIRNIVSWMFMVFIALYSLKINEKYGPGTLSALFQGKYHRPHEVQQVFMFLDLTDSTSIAEQLGHLKFFALLQDFFSDITDPILNSKGKIYQYVGDEVVISWSLRKAVSKKSNCVSCFFKIEDALEHRKPYYTQKYGLFPLFKAAVHKGLVTVGEMGVIKREIVYSGDILNTTSRILEQCKPYNQKLIISKDILEMISEYGIKEYTVKFLGEMALRGKIQQVGLYSVERT